MFTGIIEDIGIIRKIEDSGSNRVFWVESAISPLLKVDQSVAHNGVCLTVEEIGDGAHRLTAIEETLNKTNLGSWVKGMRVNIERSVTPSSRLDGHIVQGHVDGLITCTAIHEKNGSTEYSFRFPQEYAELVIEKGSVCVNGISLTAFNVGRNEFSVAIIPYTFEHTNMADLHVGSEANIEFDILGKYILRRARLAHNSLM